jgi:hypothetical protein
MRTSGRFSCTDITGINNVGTCTVDTSVSNDFHNVFKFDTGDQVRTFKFASTALVECAGQPAQICTFSQTLVYANGAFRHVAEAGACTPPDKHALHAGPPPLRLSRGVGYAAWSSRIASARLPAVATTVQSRLARSPVGRMEALDDAEPGT